MEKQTYEAIKKRIGKKGKKDLEEVCCIVASWVKQFRQTSSCPPIDNTPLLDPTSKLLKSCLFHVFLLFLAQSVCFSFKVPFGF